MSHELSHDLNGPAKKRIKDSLLLILIFCIGLAGLCYILHMSASNQGSSSHYMQKNGASSEEAIYFTATR